MFGLWYISLAIQEIRKYLGWSSSVFDIFKNNNNKTEKNALEDNKPLSDYSTTSKTDDIEIKKPTKVPEKKPDIKTTAQTQPTKPTVELPNVPAKKVPDNKPLITQKPVVDLPKSVPLVEPKTPEIEKPQTEPVTPKPTSPNPTITASTNGLSSSATLDNKQTDFDKKIFGSSVEIGDTTTTKNIKDATFSFLEEEGKGGTLKPKRVVSVSSPRNKSDTMVDAAVVKKMEDGFAKLMASDSKSLLKKHLSKEVFDKLKNVKTPTFGSSLLDCIQSGLENHDSGFGIYAPDAEAYSVFSEVFDPMIEDYHTGFKKTDKHPNRDFGDVNAFGNLDPTGEYVVSTRVRCGRSMEGYPFNPCLTEAQYKEMESKVSATLSGLEGELKGKFYPLTGMDKAVQQQLIDDHFLFKEGDRFLQTANACRYWPSGRGIYHNDNKTFLVWCNEEDHLRIISMQMGGDLGQVYRRLVAGVNDIEKRIPFSHHDRLGFLTFCPTNLGTTIRASVHIKVPKLAANKAKLEEVAGKYNLQVRGTRGEHTEAEGGIYDISNKRRMGLTEFQAVKEMYDGISEIIKLEKSL